MGTILEREEYIEQAYFFRAWRERMADNVATQLRTDVGAAELFSTEYRDLHDLATQIDGDAGIPDCYKTQLTAGGLNPNLLTLSSNEPSRTHRTTGRLPPPDAG